MKAKAILFMLVLGILVPWGTKIKAADVIIEPVFNQTEARSMLDSINAFRTGSDAWYWNRDNTEKIQKSGLSNLVYDYELEKVAMQRAAEIALYWGHTRPDGSDTWDAYSEFGYPDIAKGENIAAGYSTANSAFVGWREDNEDYSGQGHRRNMLSEGFTAVGIGCVTVNGTKYWVQEFSSNIPSGNATTANDSATLVTVRVSDSSISNVSYTSSEAKVSVGNYIAFPSGTASASFAGSWPSGTNIPVKNEVIFNSADDYYVTIENGMVKGLKEGTGTIFGSLFGNVVQVNVTVTPEITITPTATPMPTATPTPTKTPVPTPTPVPVPIVTHMEYKTTVGDYSQKIDLKTNIKNETTIEVSMTKFDGTGTSALYFSTSVGRIRLKEVVTTDKTLGHYSMESFIKIGSEKFYITSIDTYAFEKNKLTGITIGKKVKTIKKKAFANQKKLKLIEITAEKLKSVGKNAFKGISKKAVFKIKGSDKDYERVKELIIKSGVSSTVTIKHI